MNNPTLGDVMRGRYPRLIRAMQRGIGLSEPDAVNALVEHAYFGITDDTLEHSIRALGGPPAAIRLGFCRRHAGKASKVTGSTTGMAPACSEARCCFQQYFVTIFANSHTTPPALFPTLRHR